jgi:hypothetical protein
MWFNIATNDNDWMRKWSQKCPFRAIFLFTHIFDLFPNNRLVETCCDRTKIVSCGHVCRRSDNKLAASLATGLLEQVGTNQLTSTDLLQVVLSDLLSLVSNRFVAGCFNKSLRLCCQQLETDLFPQPVTAWRNQQTCRDLLTTGCKPVKCDRPVRFLAA